MDDMSAPEGETLTVSVLIVDDQLPFRAVARTVPLASGTGAPSSVTRRLQTPLNARARSI